MSGVALARKEQQGTTEHFSDADQNSQKQEQGTNANNNNYNYTYCYYCKHNLPVVISAPVLSVRVQDNSARSVAVPESKPDTSAT